MLWGAVLELIVAFAIVGTGVALFPVLRHQNEGVALGFVTSRLFEAGVIALGIISLLSIVTLQQEVGATAGANAGALAIAGRVARRDPRLVIPYRTDPPARHQRAPARLAVLPVPPRAARHPAAWASSVAPCSISSAIGQVIGINEQYSAWSAIAVLPIFLWEPFLGLWLVFKGFRKDAPLMLEAAAEEATSIDSANVSLSSIGVASKAGAA